MAQVTVEAKYIADTAQYVKALRQAAAATNALADTIPQTVGPAQQLAAGSRDMGEAAQEAGKGFTILRNAMGTAIGVAAVNMIGKITGSIKGFARASFDAAARVEELDIAMKAIGESTGLGAEAIMEATQAIRDNGIELGAAQQIAIEFAQNQLDMASASKVARVAQDLAVIAGKNSTATTQLLTRAIITGNSMLLKSAGISRQAGEAYKAYAESLGKTTKQLTAQERQMAVTNLIIEEGAKVAGTYEASMDSAGKVLRSFKRIINDIQVEVGKVLLQAFGPLIKSTYDLLSAFSKTLREGGAFAETLSMLTDVFEELTEPLVGFIKNMTQAVKSGEAIKRVTLVMTALIPVIEGLFQISQVWASVLWTALGPALQALLSVVDTLLSVLTPMLNAFNAMPDVVKTVVAGFILLQVVMAKSATAAKVFGVSFTALGVKIVASTRMMIASATSLGATYKLVFTAARAQLGAFRGAALVASTSVVIAFRTIAVAAKTLMASLGPVGWALIAVTAAFEFFSGRAQAAEHHLSNLRDGIDQTTLKLNDLGKAFIAAEFRENFSAQTLMELQSLGIGIDDMISALQNGGEEYDALIRKLKSPTARDVLGPFGADTVRRTIEGMAHNYKVAGEAAEASARTQQMANEQTQMSNRVMAHNLTNNFREISAAQIIAAQIAERSAGEFMTQAQRHEAAMDLMSSATAAAVQSMKASFDILNGAINIESATDKAQESLARMRDQLDKTKSGIDGFSKGAKENRKSIREYASDMQSLAKSFDDPRDQMEVLKAAEKEVRESLTRNKIDPKDSNILKGIQDAIAESEKAVQDMGSAVDQAESRGVEVTTALVQGIIKSVDDNKSTLEGAGHAVGEPLIEGLHDELELDSPSRVAIRAGNDFVSGLVVGLRSGHGQLATAMRSLIRQGIQAAKDEASISSPSRKTERIANQMGDGLVKGLRSSQPEVSRAGQQLMTSTLTAMHAEIPKSADAAKKAGKKVGDKTVKGYVEALSAFRSQVPGLLAKTFTVDSSSLRQALESIYGSLPTEQPLLERIMNDKQLEKFRKHNAKALIELGKFADKVDSVIEKMEQARAAFDSLMESTSRPSQFDDILPENLRPLSDIQRAYGDQGSIDSIIAMHEKLSAGVKSVYSELIAAAPTKRWANKLTGDMEKHLSTLDGFTRRALSIQVKLSDVADRMKRLDTTYSDRVRDINASFNALDKAASQNIRSLEAKWSATIKHLDAALRSATDAYNRENQVLQELISKRNQFLGQIQSGFRSFVNSLSFESAKATKEIVRETKKMANGITVTFEREIESGGGVQSIREQLSQRLDAVREFTTNIRTLMSRGLDPTLVQDFVSAGVSGAGEAAKALAASSDAELQEINQIQKGLASEITGFTQYASAQWFDSGIAQQESIVAPLRMAMEQAQRNLDMANELREAELAAAREHQEQLRLDREAALLLAEQEYAREKKVLQDEAADLNAQLNELANEIQDYFLQIKKDLPPQMLILGKEIINGMIRGLNKRAPILFARAREIAKTVRDIIARAFDINSPSGVTERMGVAIAEGLIVGMDSMTRKVEASAMRMSNAILVPMELPRPASLSPLPGAPMGAVMGVGQGSVTNYSITVNTGIATDPAETGRQVVEAIRKYERMSGPVFVSAS